MESNIRELSIINIITVTIDRILYWILITVCYILNRTKKFIKFRLLNVSHRWPCIKHNIGNRNIKLFISNISIVKSYTPMNFTIDVHPENSIRRAWWRLPLLKILIDHLLHYSLIITTKLHGTLLICKSQRDSKHCLLNYFIDFEFINQ